VKIVAVLWDAEPDVLLGEAAAGVLAPGATTVQLNLDDAAIGGRGLRLQHFDAPVRTIVSVWTEDEDGTLASLRQYADRLAAWEVEERVPLAPPGTPPGVRADALAQVAFLRRPADLPEETWRAHWLGPHTQVAIETQATFGYVQNRVLRPLTEDTPPVDAVVEELFPTAALEDIQAFYGSGGDQGELDRRMSRLMESVQAMGADRDLDVVPTSRYVFSQI
jgi:hypothetical protein